MSEANDVRSVDLPEDVVSRIERRVRYTEFESVSEYVQYVMEDVLHHVERETEHEDGADVDEREVKNRLESLGYLNE